MVGENLFGNGFLRSAAEFDFGILIDSNTTYFSLSILLLGATLETLLSCRRIFCILVRKELGNYIPIRPGIGIPILGFFLSQ